MNPAAPLLRLFAHPRLLARGPAAAPGRSFRRPARVAVTWFAAAVVALNLGTWLAMDHAWPELRDPEYGRRLKQLKARLAEHPGRPLVVAVGSSRMSMGVRPGAWENVRPANAGRPDPLLFNVSLVGSGPVMELMALRRLYADGIRPAAVVLEYWPPFLREDGPNFEPDRIELTRLMAIDRPFVRDYFRDPRAVERRMLLARVNPIYENRERLFAQVDAAWLPWNRRMDTGWQGLDAWGWLPGLDEHPQLPDRRAARLAHCERIYRTQFHGYAIDPLADRAIREAIALARGHATQVAFAFLPESTEFRGWYPPEVEKAGREYLDRLCRELKVPLIDARAWLGDEYLVDGFHLSRAGAAEFTRRFGPAVAATFPDLGQR
jgi:hypothetical protein